MRKKQAKSEVYNDILKTDLPDIAHLIKLSQKSSDFIRSTIFFSEQKLYLSYFGTLIDDKVFQRHLILALQDSVVDEEIKDIEEIRKWIPIEEIEFTDKIDVIQTKLMKGHVIVRLNENDQKCALIPLANKLGLRLNNDTENEFSVVGPKVGFVEDLETNIHLLRVKLNIPNLIVKEFTIGSISRSRIAIVYIEGVTNEQIIQTVEQRLSDIDFDVLFDSSMLDQIISDSSLTPFPLFLSTERRDRVVFALISGQVAFIMDGSPYFITGPSTLFDFFISPEDYYLPWILGSFFRLIRISGVIFSLFSTALYVAIMTFHYEVIPHNMLGPLVYSRLNVPFPPIMEALFLEITIEFLREAGARLPTKIGQTLGVVGGIIVGQAAVQAAFTSNILIIIVSLSALASFTTPIYKMANAIRFLRFPLLILAAVWGILGIFIGIGFLIVHLTRLKSLGHPYTVPIYPLRVKDLKDSFIRSSFQLINRRPGYSRAKSLLRYVPKSLKRKYDWDED
ncbi:spore germination protein [Paenibacillus psychroresistens]|uniref:Spore germination protein n=1 Tax=Paenibacillus psychroresistens TaxID=1778678 RepID=A0A6B8RL46_9BACL|nr:spore germination protein [Paenibacillus psychroresistens]QGQ96146.1 spore germination protein [Paenibacillus psychroresistens]